MFCAFAALMVMDAVVWNCGQPPLAATVYVRVYVPGVLVPRVTAPVPVFSESPAVEEYVPPAVPVLVTAAVPPELQDGEPVELIVADGAAVMTICAVVVNNAQPPLAAMV